MDRPTPSALEVAKALCNEVYGLDAEHDVDGDSWLRDTVYRDHAPIIAQALTAHADAAVREAFAEGSKYTNASESAMFYWDAICNKPHKGPRFIDDAINAAVRERDRQVRGLTKRLEDLACQSESYTVSGNQRLLHSEVPAAMMVLSAEMRATLSTPGDDDE